MEPYQAILAQGGLGILAAVFFWLYRNEKKEHDITRKENKDLMEARRLDAVETRTDVTSILPGISQTLNNIYDKIEVSKQSKRGKR